MSLLPVVPLPCRPVPARRKRGPESGERTFLVRGPCLRGTDPRLQHAGACLSLSPRARGRYAGLTLLELVVAMAIFSLVAAAAYGALSQGLVVQDRLQEQRRFWQRLETVFNLVHADFEQAVDRAPGGAGQPFNGHEYGNSAAYENVLEFTRSVNADFHAGPASPFLRVGYRLDDGGLYRRTWARLDRPYGMLSRDNLLLEGIGDIRLRYLADAGLWLARWPPSTNIGGTQDLPFALGTPRESQGLAGNDEALPRAVELTIELEDAGAYRWLFHVGHPR